jgi:hypothetical protein
MLPLSLSKPWPEPLRSLILEGCQALEAGRLAAARQAFAQALECEADIPEAHLGLALIQRPGPDYRAWLERLHAALRPAVYVEVGIESGLALQLAQPPTLAFGIDPVPQAPASTDWAARTRIFTATSDAFFADPEMRAALTGPVDFAFIDGDHRFEQVLRDFISLEALMSPGGIVALHDTWPLNAETATRERTTGFYTGDGWKIVPCLRALRPDLRLLTIPAAPTGLTLVTGLDPASTLLRDRFDVIIELYGPLPYAPAMDRLLALSGNDDATLDQLLGWRAMATAKSS